jgi:hypothetical protein
VLLLAGNIVFCQKIFRDAYIVKNNGEILNGMAEYAPNQDIPAVCVFKRFDIAVEITYKPGDIREFGYISGNRYVSKIVENKESFYEVMVSGKITLFRKGSRFFLEKGLSGIVNLDKSPIEYSDGSGKQTFDGLASFLQYITGGKTGIISEKLNSKKDLVPLVSEYNKKTGESYIVYNQEYTEEMLASESLRSGSNRNKFGVCAGMNIYYLSFSSETSQYLPDPEPEMSVTGGLSYERMISRKNDKLAIKTGLLFLKQNFYSYSESTISSVIYRDDAFFDFTGIKLPVLLQYSFKSGKFSQYVSGGLSYQIFIQKDYSHIREAEYTNHDIEISEDASLAFRQGETSWIIGIGMKMRLVNSINLNITCMNENGQGLFAKEYKPHSGQTSLLVGITF